jgi:hypothetical protein
MSGPARLRELLRGDGGLIAGVLADAAPVDGAHGATAAAGPRAAGREDDYTLLVEAIYEGYLQHYGSGRVVRADDPDLALLAGDRLYALGLARLAALGDLDAVAELADIIALCAQARAEGRDDLADAVWDAGVVALGWGASDALRAAKAAARAGDPGAARALIAAAREVVGA